ncbi:PA14 domain-containing protein [Nanoarchaeota archaeon]
MKATKWACVLIFFLIPFTSAQVTCDGADAVFDVSMRVAGVDCTELVGPIDNEFISVDAGRHLVRGLVIRGWPGQCQTNEDFYLEINSETGPETSDDADPCAESERLETLGEFNFNQGSNEIIMHTAAQCPPDDMPNSVDLEMLCIYYQGEAICGDGLLDSEEECDDGNNDDNDGCDSECSLEDELDCEDVLSGDGWLGRYYNHLASHPDMDLPNSEFPDNGHGDPLGSWDTDWYDEPYFRFLRIDPDLEFGSNFFPFDMAAEEIHVGHDFHFGVHWRAMVIAPEADDYGFSLVSDDDSWLYVDGVLVVDNSGLHEPVGINGQLFLTGEHIIDVFYAERHTSQSHMYFGFDLDDRLEIVPFDEECDSCGNDVLDDGEECDGDLGVGEHQECSEHCTLINLTYCGDGTLQNPNGEGGYEECDGNDGVDPNQFCTANCTITNQTFCGDGTMQQPNEVEIGGPLDDGYEACDGTDGVGPHQACTVNCTLYNLTYCGDGIMQKPNDVGFNESCDGSAPPGFACTENCTLEELEVCEDVLTFIGPQYWIEPFWIDGVTLVSLDILSCAENYTIYYKNHWLEEDFYCEEANCVLWNASDYNDTGWTAYSGLFPGGNESCHVFEHFAETESGIRSPVFWTCAFVDKSPPVVNKTINGLHGPMSQDDIDLGMSFYPNMTCPDCFELPMSTGLSLNCYDPEPHPSGLAEMCFKVSIDGDDATQDYCDEYSGTMIDGSCCSEPIDEFYFLEETWHELDVYCVDNVNKSVTDIEYFKVQGVPFEIYLYQKWNLISVPFVLINDSPEVVFGDLETLNTVWTYDSIAGDWLVWNPDGPSSLEHIEPGWGYWVLMGQDEILSIAGSLFEPAAFPPERDLASGWNLIGYYGTLWQQYEEMLDRSFMCGDEDNPEKDVFGTDVYCALTSLVNTDQGFPRWSSLWGYLNCGNHDVTWVPLNICMEENTMYAGRGYWVELDVPDRYVPSTVCAWNTNLICLQ